MTAKFPTRSFSSFLSSLQRVSSHKLQEPFGRMAVKSAYRLYFISSTFLVVAEVSAVQQHFSRVLTTMFDLRYCAKTLPCNPEVTI